CLTSAAKVFTPLYSLPAMLSEVGVKLYLSSGMASAALTNSRSTVVIWPSTTLAIVGGGCGEVCACEGLVVLAALPACAIATADMPATRIRQNMRADFMIRFSLNFYFC